MMKMVTSAHHILLACGIFYCNLEYEKKYILSIEMLNSYTGPLWQEVNIDTPR